MKTRAPALVIVLVVLLSLAAVQQFMAYWPREPRLAFTNDGFDDIPHLVIESGARKVDLGFVPKGGRIILPIASRTDATYTIYGHTIDGTALSRLLEIGRRDRRDIEVSVNTDGSFLVEGYEGSDIGWWGR